MSKLNANNFKEECLQNKQVKGLKLKNSVTIQILQAPRVQFFHVQGLGVKLCLFINMFFCLFVSFSSLVNNFKRTVHPQLIPHTVLPVTILASLPWYVLSYSVLDMSAVESVCFLSKTKKL